MFDPATLILLALVTDALIGDPRVLYRYVPHPVVVIGAVIEFGDRHLNNAPDQRMQAVAGGALLTVCVLGLTIFSAVLIHLTLARSPIGSYIEVVLVSTLIAFRGLYDHVRAVAVALGRNLGDGREAVAHIVGRDPDSLDEAGVARAAIESAAENFSDGVMAPVFWGLMLGLPGIAAYKAINTLDSMIGHRTPRYQHFGQVAAGLDDMVNWVPARLSGSLFCIAALLTPGADAKQAWISMLRDARKHRSPNAGWQEAAVAGALGVALAGPRQYANKQIDDAWMGIESAPIPGQTSVDHGAGQTPRKANMGRDPHDATADDVHRALRLYLTAGAALTALLAVLAALEFD